MPGLTHNQRSADQPMGQPELSWRALSVAPLVLAVLLTAAGCGSSKSSSSSPASSSPSTAPQSASPSASSTGATASGTAIPVTASETEFKIVLSVNTFHPGTYAFKVEDAGKVPHALEIDGPGVSDKASATLTAGTSTALVVTLQKGTYEIYCPVDGHKGLGMDMHITVT